MTGAYQREESLILKWLSEFPDEWVSTAQIRVNLRTGDTAGVRRILQNLKAAKKVECDKRHPNNYRWRIRRSSETIDTPTQAE